MLKRQAGSLPLYSAAGARTGQNAPGPTDGRVSLPAAAGMVAGSRFPNPNAPVIANTDEPAGPPGMFVFRRSPRLYWKFRRNSDGTVVSFHAYTFSFEVLAVELPNYPQCRVIRRHINQTVTLAHARAIGNENNTAAENSRRCRKRKTEDFLQDLIGERSQVPRRCRIGNSRDD